MAEGNGFVMNEHSSGEDGKSAGLPKVDFSSFVLSLYSSVLVQLGLVEEPTTGRKEKNLELAKQTIDMMAMIKEKTAGNLDTEEENLLTNLLHELRLAYVEAKG
ncbi:MAG: DUF1844 domain-containing protein [Desulfarculaceae bacterium]|nr:DUF1844 domain-containing protein [Desulfarculaceae bacterium]